MAFARYKSQFMPVAGLVFSIIGLIYSLVMSLGIGSEALCLTTGCAIVQDFKVFGISPWWASAAMFLFIALLCFFHMRLAARLLASIFLAGDCLFLLAMFFIAPCTSCLGVAFLIFCVWLSLRIDRAVLITARRIMAGAISITWLILFILNLGYALNEMLPGWEIAEQNGVEQKKISLYFSPSCPACREAIEIFSGLARFYPVAENDEDYLSIADISNRVQNGESMPAAISAVRAEQQAGTWVAPHLSLWQRMRGSIKIMRNQAAVLRHGYSSLPVMVFEGLPASWAGQNRIDGGAPLQPESGGSMDALPGIEQPGTGYPDTQDVPQDPALPEQPAGNGQAGTTAPYQPASPELPLDFGDTLECGRGSEAPCD